MDPYIKSSDRYKEMTEKKNRCVRITYADNFYMDILPACRNVAAALPASRYRM